MHRPGGHHGNPGRERVQRLYTGMFVLVAVLVCALVTLAQRPQPVRAAGPSGAVPESIIDRYLSTRPPLGDVTVVSVAGESAQRKLLAATLQGIVNRDAARIYLVGARPVAQDEHWINDFAIVIDVIPGDLDLGPRINGSASVIDIIPDFGRPGNVDPTIAHDLEADSDEGPADTASRANHHATAFSDQPDNHLAATASGAQRPPGTEVG